MAGEGRATLCTPEVIQQVEDLARYGMPVRRICDLLGIGKTTHYEWLQWAEDGREPWTDYADAYARGEALCQQDQLLRIAAAAENGDAKSAQWVLEHRFPGDFAPALKQDVNLGGQKDNPVRVEHQSEVELILADPEAVKLVGALTARLSASADGPAADGGEDQPDAD